MPGLGKESVQLTFHNNRKRSRSKSMKISKIPLSHLSHMTCSFIQAMAAAPSFCPLKISISAKCVVAGGTDRILCGCLVNGRIVVGTARGFVRCLSWKGDVGPSIDPRPPKYIDNPSPLPSSSTSKSSQSLLQSLFAPGVVRLCSCPAQDLVGIVFQDGLAVLAHSLSLVVLSRPSAVSL